MRAIIKSLSAAVIAIPVAAIAADSVQLTPGRWQETDRTIAMTVDGEAVPSNILQDAMQVETMFYCIPPSEAQEPALFFRGNVRDDKCALRAKAVANGRIAMSYGCDSEDGGAETWTIDGTYDKQAYAMTWKINSSTGGQPFTLTKTMEGRFLGRCTGDEKGRP